MGFGNVVLFLIFISFSLIGQKNTGTQLYYEHYTLQHTHLVNFTANARCIIYILEYDIHIYIHT